MEVPFDMQMMRILLAIVNGWMLGLGGEPSKRGEEGADTLSTFCVKRIRGPSVDEGGLTGMTNGVDATEHSSRFWELESTGGHSTRQSGAVPAVRVSLSTSGVDLRRHHARVSCACLSSYHWQ